ncbi:MAG: single-stranded DNA-binding protein, partial [Anaerolineae bacterium]|nr:single-stranded DNA-binding protein [Anaerolineae bacterium]
SSRKWTGQNGEQQEETVWFRVAVFGAQAESCYRYLSKGRAVLVEGRLRPDESGNPRTFTRNDGSTGASFEVTAQTVRFLGGGNGGNGNAAANAPQEGDEIPF